MKKRKLSLSDVIFIVFAALLLIPQTRKPIQVALNSLKVAVWSPGVEAAGDRKQVEAFPYAVRTLNGLPKNIPIGQGKLTFLNYWATWCAPCIAELPAIQKLYSDYADKVNFLLLTHEEKAVVQRFLDDEEYDLPVYSPQMQAPEILRSSSIPTTFIIDSQGNIVIEETGAADWNSKKVRQLLDDLLSK